MPRITVNSESFETEPGERLVLAIEGHGVNIGHKCGGFAKCTTCRVEFLEGEPTTMTRAEFDKLREDELFGRVRLSCQLLADHNMSVRALMTMENMKDWTDTGPVPEPTVTPEAEWYPIQVLKQEFEISAPLPTAESSGVSAKATMTVANE